MLTSVCRAVSFCGAVSLAGCVLHTNYNPIPEDAPLSKLPRNEIKARGVRVDEGLSISGGGIRAGAFGLGVMKALYDHGKLDSLDAISTVSGAGYGLYWLLSHNDPSRPFGTTAFNEQNWPKLSAELQLRADFARYQALWRLPFPANSAVNFYEDRLVRFATPSGGRLDPLKSVADYEHDVRSGAIPYFVLNTTLITSRKGKAKRIEITPQLVGNDTFGYHFWTNQPDEKLPMVKAVEMSGAVLGVKLGQTVPDYIHRGDKDMTLVDGGGGSLFRKGENLGAYALVRRGIGNVVIVDAGADPSYKFEDYKNLKELLLADGITLNVKDIDNHVHGTPFEKSFCEGIATGQTRDGRSIRTQITYIKMCMPKDLYEVGTRDGKRAYVFEGSNRRHLAARDERFFVVKGGRKVWNEKPLSTFDNLPSQSRKLDKGFYAAVVEDYATSLNVGWNTRARLLGKHYRFPHMTTADQSYYMDQFEATLGLGYLQATAALEQSSTLKR